MIAGLRAVVRAVSTVLFLVTWAIAHAIARPWYRGQRIETWRRRVLGGGCRGVLRLLNVHVRIEGPVPGRAGVLVTNHLGYVDVLVLGSVLPAVFVSRADVADWPLIGPLARASGTLFLDRERKRELPRVVEAMHAWLGRGVQVIFFPEGTSGRGDVVMPFRSSLFEVAVLAGATVHAAALDYRTHPDDLPADEAVCWWGEVGFLPHAWKLLRSRRVDARIAFASGVVAVGDRKTMARDAQHAVEACFRPSVREETVRP